MLSIGRSCSIFILVGIFFVFGCQSVNYVSSELKGTAKPAGGLTEQVPVSMSYPVSDARLRQATIEILDEDGYIYAENPSTHTIRTEPKSITDQSEVRFMGASYYSKLFIKIVNSTVTYKVLFDKKSNVTMAEQNLEFPEKANELRKDFFLKLNKKINLGANYSQSNTNSHANSSTASLSKSETLRLQQKLNELGYSAGPVDGIMGEQTRTAIESFQRDNGLDATGIPEKRTVKLLNETDANPKSQINHQSSYGTTTNQSGDETPASNIDSEGLFLRVIGNEKVEIKSQPSLFADVVSVISPGERIEYIEKSGSWYNVKTGEGNGFIYEDFVKVD